MSPIPKPSEAAERASFRAELRRKAIHMAFVIVPITLLHPWLPWPQTRGEWTVLLVLLVLTALSLDLIRIHERRIGQFFRSFFGEMIRDHESTQLLGSTYLLIAALLAVDLFPRPIAAAAVGFTVLGDALAALVGRTSGRTKFFGKVRRGHARGILRVSRVGGVPRRGRPPELAGRGHGRADRKSGRAPADTSGRQPGDHAGLRICHEAAHRTVLVTPKPVPAPDDFEAAHALAQRGRFSAAVQNVEATLERGASREALATPAAQALASIARHAERAHDLAAAEQALETAVRIRPQFADLQYQLGCVRNARGHRLEARRALEKAVAINPRYVAARVELAMLDARDGMVGEALGALRTLANESAIGDPRAFSQGMKRLEHAEWDEADALLRVALRIGDAELDERLERFHALMRADQPAQAAEVLREALPRHEGYPDLHHLLGTAEMRLGHFDDALASLGHALELNPEFHHARYHFALALNAAGMSATAMDQMSLVVQHDPKHRGAREWMRAHEARFARNGAKRKAA